MSTWEIEFYRGKVDVRCNRRAFAYDLDDLEEAERKITRSRKFSPGDKVVVIEENGARRTISSGSGLSSR